MERRLYFTFPLPAQARRAVKELIDSGIARTAIHAVARDADVLDDLPRATPAERDDLVWTLERRYWSANLAVFFAALVGFLAAVYFGRWVYAATALLFMAVTFVTGERFAAALPHTHLDELRVPLGHGEVVVMVDVAADRVRDVEQLLSRLHPEVGVGGVGWHIHGVHA
jgi:hypothetical protein